MKTILRWRWLIAALWLGAMIALRLAAPDIGVLVREKGQFRIPQGYSSTLAAELQREGSPNAGEEMAIMLVFHDEKGLSQEDMKSVDTALGRLNEQREQLGISRIASYLNNPQLKDQLISKDNKTVLALVDVAQSESGGSIGEIRDKLNAAIRDIPVEHYYTGGDLINEDLVQSSQSGLKKTEWITVAFILLVLVLVFRSPVAPFIPLLTVGVAYAASSAIVSFLAKWFDFPLSTFTQVFMVAVLFGIGTDYCILLLSRFKEELAKGGAVDEAVAGTYRTAGKTVLFSALAAFVGFASIGLARFNLYQSAVAVAVGVFVLVVALLTIVPLFMKVLGKRLFWPIGGSLRHKESRIWGAAGSFSLGKPYWALLLVAVIIVPLLLVYNGRLSFDSIHEISSSYDSVKGFNLISQSFSPGEAMPTTIVLRNKTPMDNPQALSVIEKISAAAAQVEHVSKVRSASRPLGDAPQVSSRAAAPGAGTGQEAALQSAGYRQVLDMYMSADRTVTTLDVIFDTNPYAAVSLDAVQKLHDAVGQAIKGTSFEGDAFGINGVSGVYADLRTISDKDYERTVALMLIAIFLIMTILLRSLVMPLYLIAGLMLCYFSSLAVDQIIFVDMLGHAGINWTIPFFSFVLLTALGVDYSIFLMDRFNEHRGEAVKEAILLAMRKMGTVIFSAAIILAGTFAAMLPSGVQSLLQIATTVLSGLILYALVILPLFAPVMVRMFGANNWWPFGRGARRQPSSPDGGDR